MSRMMQAAESMKISGAASVMSRRVMIAGFMA